LLRPQLGPLLFVITGQAVTSRSCSSPILMGRWSAQRNDSQKDDQVTRSSEQDEALTSRPSTASQDKADRSKWTKPVAQRRLFVCFCSIGAYEKFSGDTQARSLCLKWPSSIFGALSTPSKPNRKPGRATQRVPMLIIRVSTPRHWEYLLQVIITNKHFSHGLLRFFTRSESLLETGLAIASHIK